MPEPESSIAAVPVDALMRITQAVETAGTLSELLMLALRELTQLFDAPRGGVVRVELEAHLPLDFQQVADLIQELGDLSILLSIPHRLGHDAPWVNRNRPKTLDCGGFRRFPSVQSASVAFQPD